MKQPMFAIEIGPDKEIRIVVTRPNGTRVVITGGQYQGVQSQSERKCASPAKLLEEKNRQAHERRRAGTIFQTIDSSIDPTRRIAWLPKRERQAP
jgi:hypothetical protein